MSRSLILPLSFFNRPTLAVSRDLLGKFLVHRIGVAYAKEWVRKPYRLVLRG